VSTAHFARPVNPGSGSCPGFGFSSRPRAPAIFKRVMGRFTSSHFLAPGLALALAGAGDERMAFSLTSTAFKDGATIPSQHTCDGADRSPPLVWSDAPSGTAAFALIADDPDAPAGTWVHWVVYNLPASTTELPENVAKVESLDLGAARQGRNDFHRPGYGGPCPPPGPAHRYLFRLYALDAPLKVRPGATKKDVEAAMQGHTLGMAQLMGTYARQKR
jgi:Raf kinase inhibitor-like YbhB/YbcL family protein